MKITAKHAKGQSVRSRQHMKKRLLLSRVALEGGHIVYRHTQVSALVETYFADAALAFFDETTMTAGETVQRTVREVLS